jgi:hypothetical protein
MIVNRDLQHYQMDNNTKPMTIDHGYCFIYSSANTVTLEQYLTKKNYARKLITLDKVTPQVFKGKLFT